MNRIKRAARELALNILYQVDSAGLPFDEAVDTALEFADLSELDSKEEKKSDEARAYARELAYGIKEKRRELDTYITKLAKDYSLDRLAAVDRNILRIGLFEITYVDSVPDVVVIDEAVEIGKKFSTDESGKYINGILGAYLKEQDQLKAENESKNT